MHQFTRNISIVTKKNSVYTIVSRCQQGKNLDYQKKTKRVRWRMHILFCHFYIQIEKHDFFIFLFYDRHHKQTTTLCHDTDTPSMDGYFFLLLVGLVGGFSENFSSIKLLKRKHMLLAFKYYFHRNIKGIRMWEKALMYC